MQKIKILYVVSTLERKGPTNQLFYIIKYLNKQNFDAEVLTLSVEPENSLMGRFLEEGISVSSLKLGRIKGILFNRIALGKAIKKFRPNIIQSMGLRADGLVSRFRFQTTCITTSRNFPLVDYPQKFGSVKGGLMAKRHLKTLKKLNVVSCSKSIAAELKSVGIDSHTIQNGVDTEIFKPTEDRSAKRVKMSLPLDAIIFVVVGSLISRKNTRMVIDAFPSNIPQACLLILGDGPEKELLQESSKGKNVLFVGDTSEVVNYLQCSDFMISASLAEGLPNAVLEGMACGLSTILSDIPSHREIMIESSLESQLFKDKEELEKMIGQAVVKETQFLQSRDLLEVVYKRFSAKIMSRKYQELYKKYYVSSI